ncbi:VOC family protein [Hyphomonadaceae bacterium BL14]|nr:VOC family protein [Hyphomonadaceae bacterium BL14]
MSRPRFHLAFPVHDLAAARAFYAGVLNCPTGRESESWIDFDLLGHQIVAHLSPGDCTPVGAGGVDGQAIPVRHFGLIVDWDVFDDLAARLKAAATPFLVEPYLRFAGSPGEQKTLFVSDPSGNALEFKAFRDEAMIFATDGRLFA